ncbi:MAG TPA: hypothetical protein PK385_07930 [Spirochaetota bacterium]|nr:hypothetical protein [Spirochaetota bacterium]HOS55972.1 hypothetical protein [Spirochaetota bacterium]HQF78455.1 hypothetical protein [Spirochaetota bacterium]
MDLLILFLSIFSSISIVLIGRFLDKKNRSFEKIAKLSKNIKEDLYHFAEEKFQSLKDFDNCIDVSLQKGDGLLEVLNKSINDLEEKYNSIDKEKERVSSFFQKIDILDNDLRNIAEQAQEIQNSKELIESVENKIDKFKKEIALVEKDMYRISDDLKKENTEQLKQIKTAVIAETEVELSSIKENISALRSNLTLGNQEMASVIKQNGKELRDELENTRISIENLKDVYNKQYVESIELFKEEISSIDNTVTRMKENYINDVVEKIKEIDKNNEDKLEYYKDSYKEVYINYDNLINDKLSALENTINSYEKRASNIEKDSISKYEEIKNRNLFELRSSYQNILKEIEQYGAKIGDNVKFNIITTGKETEDRYKNIYEKLKSLENEAMNKNIDFENQITKSVENFKNIQIDFDKRASEKLDNFNEMFERIGASGLNLENEIFATIKNNLSSFKTEVNDKLKSLEIDVINSRSLFEEEINSFSLKIGSMKDEISNIDLNLQNSKDMINEKSNFVKEEAFKEIENVNQQITNSISMLKSYYDNEKEKVFEKIDESVKSLLNSSDDKSAEIAHKYNQTLENIEKELQTIKNSYSDKISLIENDIYDNANKIEQELLAKQNAVADNLFEKFNVVKNEIENDNIQTVKNIKQSFANKNFEIEESLNLISAKFLNFNQEIENNFIKIGDNIKEKIIEVDSKLDYNISNITDKSNSIENQYKESSLRIIEQNNLRMGEFNKEFDNLKVQFEYFRENIYKDVQNKVDTSSYEINNLLSEGMLKINEINEKVKNEAKNLIELYKSDVNKIKISIKNIDEKYNEKLASKYDDLDKSLLSKMREANDIIENIQEIKNKYELKANESFTKVYDLETLYTTKINEIEEEFKNNFTKLLEKRNMEIESLSYNYNEINDKIENLKLNIDKVVDDKILNARTTIDETFESSKNVLKEYYQKLEEQTVRKINDFKGDIVKIKDTIKGLDEKYNQFIVEKISTADEKFREKFSEIDAGYRNSLENLNAKVIVYESDFAKKIEDIETVYSVKMDQIINDKALKVDCIAENFDKLNSDIAAVKDNLYKDIDGRIAGSIEKANATLDERLSNFGSEIQNLESGAAKEIDIFKSALFKIKNLIQNVDKNFSQKFNIKLTDLNGKLESRIEVIENEYKEKTNALIKEKAEQLIVFKNDFQSINSEINRLKTKLDVEINEKITQGNGFLEEVFEKGKNNISEQYKFLEDETKRNIKLFQNDIMKIKQNILQIDERINEKISGKFENVDLRLMDKINEIQDKYKESIDEMNAKVATIENDFRNKLDEIEDIYNDKNEKMIDRSFEKFNSLSQKFGDLSNNLNAYKEKIEKDIASALETGKIENAKLWKDSAAEIETDILNMKTRLEIEINEKLMDEKANIDEIISRRNKEIIENYKIFEDETLIKMNYYKENLEKFETSLVNVDKKFDEHIFKKLADVDRVYYEKINGIIDSIKLIENDYNGKITEIESDYLAKSGEIINQTKEDFDTIQNKFEMLLNRINKVETSVETEISVKIENGLSDADNLISEKLSQLNSVIDNFDQTTNSKIDSVKSKLDDFDNVVVNLENKFDIKIGQKMSDIEIQYGDKVKELNQNISLIEEDFKEKIRSIRSDCDEVNRSSIVVVENEVNILKNTIDEISKKIENGLSEADGIVGEKLSQLNSVIDNFDQTTNSKIDSVKSKLDDFDNVVVNLENKFDIKIGQKMSDIEIQYGDKVKELNQNISLIEEDFKEKIRSIRSDCDEVNRSSIVVVENEVNVLRNTIEETSKLINSIKSNLDGEIQEKLENGRKEIDWMLTFGSEKIKEEFKNIEKDTIENISYCKTNISQLKDDISGMETKFNDIYENKIYQFDLDVTVRKNQILDDLNLSKEDLDNKLNAFENELTAKLQNIKDEFSNVDHKFDVHIEDLLKNADEKYKSNLDSINARYSQNFKSVTESLENLKIEFETNLFDIEERLKNRAEFFINQTDKKSGDITALFNEMSSTIQYLKDSMKTEIDNALTGANNQINIMLEDGQNALLRDKSNFEKEAADLLSGYKNELTSIQYEISEIDKKYDDRLNEKFQYFDQSYNSKILNINDTINSEMDNLNNKIIVIESDAENKIASYKKEIENLSVSMKEIDRKYNEELDNKMKEYEEILRDKLTSQTINYDEQLKKSIEKTDEFRTAFTKRLDEILLKYRDDADAITGDYENRYNKFSSDISDLNAKVDEIKSAVDNDLVSSFNEGKNAIKEILDSGKIDLSKQYRELENDTVAKINNYRTELYMIKQSISGIEDKMNEYISDKAKDVDGKLDATLLSITNKYSINADKLDEKLDKLEKQYVEKFKELESDVIQRNNAVIQKNLDTFDSFVENFNSLSKDISTLKSKIDEEVAVKIEEGKKIVADVLDEETGKMKEKFAKTEAETIQNIEEYKKEMMKLQLNMKQIDDRFTARYLEHSNVLDKKIAEIDMDIKKFEKSTGLFEKANNMKEKLTNDIKEIKESMASIKSDRNDIIEVEKKMLNIGNIYSITEEKYSKLLGDKKKIDNISLVVNELKQITDDIENKMETIKGAKIAISNLENKIDLTTEKFKKIETYIEELDNKEDKIAGSIQSIDGFDSITDSLNKKIDSLEKKFDDLDFKRSTFEKSFKSFEKDAAILTKSEIKIGEVVDKFNQMDLLVEDLETRTEYINKMREWLVKAETNIENLNADTDKRIKLIESLLSKASQSPGIQNKLKDDNSKKEVVLQLSAQGWSIDDIAKNLSLSVGEVELILDLEYNTAPRR